MLNKKTEKRYLDYLIIYTNIILNYSDELKKKCKKKSSGEIKVNWSRYTYFGTGNWVTLMNKKDYLEISFSFNTEDDFILFYKNKFHNFIESDLNTTWLWRDFPSNSIVRTIEFNECFENLLSAWKIDKKDKGFIIPIEEIHI